MTNCWLESLCVLSAGSCNQGSVSLRPGAKSKKLMAQLLTVRRDYLSDNQDIAGDQIALLLRLVGQLLEAAVRRYSCALGSRS